MKGIKSLNLINRIINKITVIRNVITIILILVMSGVMVFLSKLNRFFIYILYFNVLKTSLINNWDNEVILQSFLLDTSSIISITEDLK